ncbi:MAG: phosphate acetyltransferase [Candidatus Omnitrophica bacterium]|nr:phosphate acetyltransferase [Candidatus Omnitrophota bacterium]MBU4488558.1 phosphate acetyltransferase [Candidatus Omnitrophota bacterium]MCG2705433.1 phosphate acetyltransferase [Candidatus Omnitrophota bacterium]
MGKINSLIERAKKDPKRIVFAEAGDERVLLAIKRITAEHIAKVVLIDETGAAKKSLGLAAEIIVPSEYSRIDEVAKKLYELKKHKGITEKDAKATLLKDPLCLAAILTRMGIVDGFVAGAVHTTRDVVRAAINYMEIDRSLAIVSGAFLMELADPLFGASGFFVFSDCGVVPMPSAKQLARIAISAGDLLEKLFKIKPRIAFLTYSSKGSAEGESVERAKEAVKKVKEKRPDFIVDGELQFDTATVPEVAKRKAPKSPIKGDANVLIFPNLDAGNITYKAVERLAKATAVGPALLGFTKPCSDLSRGSSAEDIVNATALTAVRAQLGI